MPKREIIQYIEIAQRAEPLGLYVIPYFAAGLKKEMGWSDDDPDRFIFKIAGQEITPKALVKLIREDQLSGGVILPPLPGITGAVAGASPKQPQSIALTINVDLADVLRRLGFRL